MPAGARAGRLEGLKDEAEGVSRHFRMMGPAGAKTIAFTSETLTSPRFAINRGESAACEGRRPMLRVSMDSADSGFGIIAIHLTVLAQVDPSTRPGSGRPLRKQRTAGLEDARDCAEHDARRFAHQAKSGSARLSLTVHSNEGNCSGNHPLGGGWPHA
jgi:hypothetical protein